MIEHEQWLGKLFEAYDGIIKAFTFEQLQKGVINEDIAVLYHHYLTKEAMTPHVVKAMPAIIFKHHIHCDHPGIVGVIIDYSELGEEKYYPLDQGMLMWIFIWMITGLYLWIPGADAICQQSLIRLTD